MKFLLLRYVIAGAALVGAWATLRFRSVKLGLALVITLGLLSWLLAWLPLEQPYGLKPGTETSFDFAIMSAGAARGEVLEGWVLGRRNPRPAWSLLWYALSPGDPVAARGLVVLLAPLMLIALPCVVYWLVRGAGGQDRFVALTSAFTAVLASSVSLDTFRPFSLFYQEVFFATPRFALALVLSLAALGLAWRPRARWPIVSGVLLGVLGFLDTTIFVWAMLTLLFGEVLIVASGKAFRWSGTWLAILLGGALASPQIALLLRRELLVRIPSREEVDAFRTVFRDIFVVSSDMGPIFGLALFASYLLWKRGGKADTRIVSMVVASYGVWLVAAVLFHFRPFSEAKAVIHLVRFNVALAAGVGALVLSRRFASRLKESGWLDRPPWRTLSVEPLAFVLVLLFLFPATAPFLWRPLMIDPLYYPSLYEWDASVRRLERWMLDNTTADEVVLTGDDTGEWVASLTGRRVLKAERVLPRSVERERRRLLRRFFLSGNAETMRAVLEETEADILVLDPSLREVYWEFDETLLETSGLFKKAHQIGDRYAIYRVR